MLVAVGKPKFPLADMVKPGAAVIDIGINQVTGPNGEAMIVGDVDRESVKDEVPRGTSSRDASEAISARR